MPKILLVFLVWSRIEIQVKPKAIILAIARGKGSALTAPKRLVYAVSQRAITSQSLSSTSARLASKLLKLSESTAGENWHFNFNINVCLFALTSPFLTT